MSKPTGTVIEIAAGILRDTAGRLLLVRKQGTEAFMQPGGKLESGESPAFCLLRELREELAICADIADLHSLGIFAAPAANEAGMHVKAHLFLVHSQHEPEPQAEIEEVLWIDPEKLPAIRIAPLTATAVLPLVKTLT